MKAKLLRYVPHALRNRYGAGLLAMVLWICLFADYDLYTMLKLRHQLGELKEQRDRYSEQIAETREQLHEISSDQALLEKFAREKYLMKRDNEDIFVVVPKQP
ncbi:MAG: septum formation initiator family protein [Flavobacteriales bacterium]|nr:septum formation initiator family protein [Flavobacteriales bacterium]MBP9079376.1 septum formation initiator family protein [Flavobacteriales bacterium]